MHTYNMRIKEPLGEQNFSKADSKNFREEIEKYITSTNYEFQKSLSPCAKWCYKILNK